jgi:hypothetical protein
MGGRLDPRARRAFVEMVSVDRMFTDTQITDRPRRRRRTLLVRAAVSALALVAVLVPSQGSAASVAVAGSSNDPGLTIFSPGPWQSDYGRMFTEARAPQWRAMAGRLDLVNVHAAAVLDAGDTWVRHARERLGEIDRDFALEVQAVGFARQTGGLPSSCNERTTAEAAACGGVVAMRLRREVGARLEGNGGPSVKLITIDSPMYDAFHAVYGGSEQGLPVYDTAGVLTRPAQLASAFTGGFIAQLRESFGSDIDVALISHAKYERVDGVAGMEGRLSGGQRCYNTCHHGARPDLVVNEDVVLDRLLDSLQADARTAADLVLLDVSWSSLWVGAGPVANARRVDRMIEVARNVRSGRQVKVGTVVHTDDDLRRACGHDECWHGEEAAPTGACTTSAETAAHDTWRRHMLSYVSTIRDGGSGVLNLTRHADIDAMMIASWHSVPSAALHGSGDGCPVTLRDILSS